MLDHVIPLAIHSDPNILHEINKKLWATVNFSDHKDFAKSPLKYFNSWKTAANEHALVMDGGKCENIKSWEQMSYD